MPAAGLIICEGTNSGSFSLPRISAHPFLMLDDRTRSGVPESFSRRDRDEYTLDPMAGVRGDSEGVFILDDDGKMKSTLWLHGDLRIQVTPDQAKDINFRSR